jgi:hypothetical protein
MADCKHGFESLEHKNPSTAKKPWTGECLKLVIFGISLPQYFRWAAVLYHAESASMRVGAKCFWKFRPA